ncbi:hypothetical protein COCSADRAFT_96304 [Bipolaris sorokiniana ND90Pr]|uniref:Uncharacterized protein n=1 Tax=Cochliobolus sativus (strain ND90Pr / ATCC 201652) TaxID=665912 RepID=M2SWJ3_COCSN|nr:uncharacterized protein COCSADRAFT_96304 [Bipolaris sorokiniana ND90Pr]EMD61356.1 hypothetical protein COCSADRAFT_96304 [Bipolaris sorokiniana ND90Pr]
MYILQTTTAVLIAFLAILAYNEVRNRLVRNWPRRKDLETPHSPIRPVASDIKPFIPDHSLNKSLDSVEPDVIDEDLARFKQLYYKLHNLEYYPEIIPECRELLLGLFSSTIADAIKEPDNTILSVERFSPDSLKGFLAAKDVDVTNRWEEYLARRRGGEPREMFGDKEEAKWWLKQAAPVKYVDGAWLGHINKISTPFKYRQITKNAWQVMSEELGDGDVAKNHVHVYRELMEDIDARLPEADSQNFIHPRHGLNEVRCWKAAMAQLTISLFPHDFLPEVLGFNMAYESLPLHLLKTVKELRELRLNPYYFELHISIDNADSGHAAMAMAAVSNYINLVAEDQGEEAAHIAWKRVQAGYILAEGLPTTPESPSLKSKVEEPFPRTDTEAQVVAIYAAKSSVAHKIHCNSRLKIGRRSLVDWLEPNAFKNPTWQRDFLHDLSNCKPWVIKGHSTQSRLIKELSWEGKMFGSFTENEVGIVSAWINELASPPAAVATSDLDAEKKAYYWDFTGQISEPDDNNVDVGLRAERLDILTHYPVFRPQEHLTDLAARLSSDLAIDCVPKFEFSKLHLGSLLPLWFVSPALLEGLPAVPVRAASTFGSAVVRILRAQAGFSAEGVGVAGMDEVHRTDDGEAVGIVELGLELCRNAGIQQPCDLRKAVSLGEPESAAFAEWMIATSMRWLVHRDALIGMTWAFMELHEAWAQCKGEVTLLSTRSIAILQEIAIRERKSLQTCRSEIYQHSQRRVDFLKGVAIGRQAVESCFTQEEEVTQR